MVALVRMAGAFFAYLCVATVLAQVICVAMFANSGTFTKDKFYSLMAIVYGIDEEAIREDAPGFLQDQGGDADVAAIGSHAVDDVQRPDSASGNTA